MNLNFEPDEHILVQTADVYWISDKGQKLDGFVLSNKGLYCVYKEKAGLFSKPEDMLYRFNLEDILIKDEVSQIEVVKVKNERCLQILFKHGAEHFSFQRVPKRNLDAWLDSFKEVLGVVDAETVKRQQNIERLNNLAGNVVDGVSTLIGTGSKMLKETIDQMAENRKNANRRESMDRMRGYRSTPVRENPRPAQTYYEERAKEKPAPKVEEPKEEVLYYFAIDGQQRGPYTKKEIPELAISGMINRSTLAWTKGLENWQKMETIESLKEIAESMPPTL